MTLASRSQRGDSKPNILYLTHRVPYPPNRGDRIRTYHLMKRLAQDARVHLAFPTWEPIPAETHQKLGEMCEQYYAAPVGDRSRWASAAWSFATGRSATEGLFRSSRLRGRINEWAEQTKFDAVVAVCSSMVQYLDAPILKDIPTVVDLIDVDSQKWFDYAEHARWPKRTLLGLEARRVRRIEASLPGRVDAVTVVADREAELFASFTGRSPQVIRNGVDLDYFQPVETSAAGDPCSCVFVGALDYEANIDGAVWFCHEVWPIVHERFPDAVFNLVGSRPTSEVRQLGRMPGVELVGEVPDVRPHLHGAGVVVVPLRVARGVQNKVLEALAAGKATVVSPEALSGIQGADNGELVRAQEPTQWADAICDLFTNRERRADLGQSGRRFVENTYRWSVQLSKLSDLPGLGPVLRVCPAMRNMAID